MEIIFKGRQTEVPARFREYATGKLSKLEKLDQKAIRVDVEVSVERNPRQASQKERVELTVRSRGPAIRAEAAAEDRMVALDLALAKLDSRLRRAADRRKSRHGGHGPDWRLAEPTTLPDGAGLSGQPLADVTEDRSGAPGGGGRPAESDAELAAADESAGDVRPEGDSVVPISMDGDGPLVVRQKFHRSDPIPIDQALLEMELVGHDFYLFHDVDSGLPSVVYRRRGYQYGVIRLVEDKANASRKGNADREGDADGEGGGPARGVSVPGRRRPESSSAEPSSLAGRSGEAAARP